MSNLFNERISAGELAAILELKCTFDESIMIASVSDSNIGGANSVCDYVKGPLPHPDSSLVLIAVEQLPGFNCLLHDNPQEKVCELIDFVSAGNGFQKVFSNIANGTNITIGKNCVIEDDVFIGDDTVIEHNVVIHSGTRIGRNCIVRSGSVIGGEGYGFITKTSGVVRRQPFIGQVFVGDEVEIGYNCAIVRGAVGDTHIGNRVKIDNLVHIAHDCTIGEGATVTAGVSLCGYVSIGANVRIAPNATIKQRIDIGDEAVVGLGAVVLKNVPAYDTVFGNPSKSLKRIKR